jgi:hypothetical protein
MTWRERACELFLGFWDWKDRVTRVGLLGVLGIGVGAM